MHSVFRTDTLSLAAVRNLKVYATLAQLSRKLSNEIVRKSLLIYITNTITHTKYETVNGYGFSKNDISTWVGNRLHNERRSAIIRVYGVKSWYRNGKLHREDGPANIYPEGRKQWWQNGRRHREDGPAVIWEDGYRAWYQNDRRHREDGPAVVHADGDEEWYRNGKRLK